MSDPTRVYRLAGRDYPSVTSVLRVVAKDGLIAWAAAQERAEILEIVRQLYPATAAAWRHPDQWLAQLERALGETLAHRRQTRAAGRLGSAVHEAIAAAIRAQLGGPPVPLPALGDAEATILARWRTWWEATGWRPLVAEAVCWHPREGYAGSADLVVARGRRWAVVDIKTSRALYPEMMLQVDAYRRAIAWWARRPVDAVLVRLPKTAEDTSAPEIVEIPTDPRLAAAFRGALALYRWLVADQPTRTEQVRVVEPEALWPPRARAAIVRPTVERRRHACTTD